MLHFDEASGIKIVTPKHVPVYTHTVTYTHTRACAFPHVSTCINTQSTCASRSAPVNQTMSCKSIYM